jgi:hypothetical protein
LKIISSQVLGVYGCVGQHVYHNNRGVKLIGNRQKRRVEEQRQRGYGGKRQDRTVQDRTGQDRGRVGGGEQRATGRGLDLSSSKVGKVESTVQGPEEHIYIDSAKYQCGVVWCEGREKKYQNVVVWCDKKEGKGTIRMI